MLLSTACEEPVATCGNGLVEPGETCDGDCPADCDDGNACSVDSLTGDASSCLVICDHTPIATCADGDGCCPAGCNTASDDDCSVFCGNGVVESGETCDGNCPSTCNDGNACTTDVMTGSADACSVQCSYTVVSECADGDGCCPATCQWNTDSDCSASCGNGVVEVGETCDLDCPEGCDDGNTCTIDLMTGSAANCSIDCTFVAVNACEDGDDCCPAGCNTADDDDCSAFCGNGVVESGETCDGNCPSTCNDGNACTIDTLTGSAETCNVDCSHDAIATCTSGDGCCAAGCDALSDGDCSAFCGNGTLEPGETCDGDCPEDCDDENPCTIDVLTGSAANCSVACTHMGVSTCDPGDDCCPAGCTSANDDSCPPFCGNGALDAEETCDGDCPWSCNDGDSCTVDYQTGSAENCNVVCNHETLTGCNNYDLDGCCPAGCTADFNTPTAFTDLDCEPVCGNGVAEGLEACDGTDVYDLTCADVGYGGSIWCTPHCTLETAACIGCDWSAVGHHIAVVPSVSTLNVAALDSAGRLHVAYPDVGLDRLVHAVWNGQAWTRQALPGTNGVSSITCLDLVLDSQDNPHLVSCWPSTHSLIHGYWDGTDWSFEEVDTENDVGSSASLALGSNGQPRVAYHSTSVPGLVYAVRTPAGWTPETIDNIGPDAGESVSLVLDVYDRPHIAYTATWGQQPQVRYARYLPGSWNNEEVVSMEVEEVSMALDFSGRPHIATLADLGTSDQITHWRKPSSSWQSETVVGPAAGLDLAGFAFALDADDEPHVAFNVTSGGRFYRVRAHGGWTERYLSNWIGGAMSLALDRSGYPDIDAYVVSAEAGRLLFHRVRCR